MPFSISLATRPDQREAVFRFRYSVLVEEEHRSPALADHHLRVIEEPWDATGRVLVARFGDTLVGAWRVNYSCEKEPGEELDFFETARFTDARPHTMAFTATPLVACGFRHSTVPDRLARAAYAMNRSEGITHDFVACSPEYEAFFTDLGYRPYLSRRNDPELGEVVPLVLILRDQEHLAQVYSPLLNQTSPGRRVVEVPRPFAPRRFLTKS